MTQSDDIHVGVVGASQETPESAPSESLFQDRNVILQVHRLVDWHRAQAHALRELAQVQNVARWIRATRSDSTVELGDDTAGDEARSIADLLDRFASSLARRLPAGAR